jgi:hypothetical protein
LSSSTVIELVRMTVLVVAGSTTAAFGIAGGIPGLVSWAGISLGPVMEAATRNVKAQVLMQLQLSP